ncbi:hypothetical protein ACJMK2_010688 [Sinanodonta woodiana]|uniref:DNA topoisomerase I n=1 Tax=Sinanodonta woodiana TaxID=1069815 RepID=A0ABD3VIM9_SINWO
MMTPEEKSTITDLKKCNFKEMYEYFKAKSEERKNMSKEEKKKIKAQNEAIQKEYGVCMMDGHKEKIGNFKIEPPGLFRGRGDHPKQGMLKMRINPEDVIINCSSDSKIPEPPAGHRWKKVLHNNKVTWLASWTENIQGHTKYVILNATFKLKGEKDLQKYEIARKLHRTVDKIRAHYREDWKSKEMMIQQRAVAMYFIDKLALSVDNEKEEGETADTVGCCSLRVEHIKLHDELDGKESVVEFDFLGKDSIRYYNTVSVDKRVYKNLKLFMDNKQPGDDLFDRLNTSIMNEHLNSLMKGLTAKVFRTYNASKTLQEQLNLLTNPDDPVPVKLLSYNRANRAVAILCHHQLFNAQVETLQMKARKRLSELKVKNNLGKPLERTTDPREATGKLSHITTLDENKEIALGTSKLNYLDPRISVACIQPYSRSIGDECASWKHISITLIQHPAIITPDPLEMSVPHAAYFNHPSSASSHTPDPLEMSVLHGSIFQSP